MILFTRAIVLCTALFLFTFTDVAVAGDSLPDRDKRLGLTLSGGGARGLAHVGVLHVIDSLGIQIDYISGTSMGSIVGGMYAAGYSAREIEQFALAMNWEAMLSRRTDLSYIHPVWRESYKQYIIELPIEERKIQISTGAIEGQQMWNTLNELFFHVYDISDFSQLDIPFACVATDVENGEAIVMKGGNLVTAIRASMAIPSVFTVVERDGYKLIDGGVVNNFPVKVAKDMGADYVIGVNVSQGLRPAEELRTPIDIIYQMGFFSDARSLAENRKVTDLYIEPQLEEYNAASFINTAEIIEQGKRAARAALEDLAALYPAGGGRSDAGREAQREQFQLVVDSIAFEGLNNVRPWFAKNTLNISPGDTIRSSNLTRAVNRLFATNNFDRVLYRIQVCEETNRVILLLEVAEKPFVRLSGAMHFNSFTGVGLIPRIVTNKFFIYNTHAEASFFLGEQPAYRTKLTYFTSDLRDSWFQWINRGQRLTFPLYDNFELFSEYKQSYFRSEVTYNRLLGNNGYYSLGTAFYYQSLAPNIRSPITIEGRHRSFEAIASWNHHSLDKNVFPEKGQRIQMRGTFFFNQHPSFSTISLAGEDVSLEDLDIYIRNFFQAKVSWESYVPIRERLTQILHFQLGYNFKYKQGFINSFNVGGTHAFLENQITFAGLNEYGLIGESALVGALGYQYSFRRNIYLSALANAAVFDFKFGEPENISSDNFVFGGGVTLGYDGMLGPVGLTFSFSPQTGDVIGYINLGWAL